VSVDDTLLIGRIVFLVALYLFLLLLAFVLWRELRSRATSATERAPADLLIVEPFETGLDPGDRIPLLAVSTIGRAEGNEIVLRDGFVSDPHARLNWNGKGFVVEDLKSTNGTKINDKTIKKPSAVKLGDFIIFGRVKVQLVGL
jgi:hypothetical protein